VTGRTRRYLRRTLAFLALGGFPVLVVLSYRPSGARTLEARDEVAETLLRESQGIRDRLRFEDFDYSESEGDAEVYGCGRPRQSPSPRARTGCSG
jgi:hypothetical protein